MAYQSEADHYRMLFEQQKAISIESTIRCADLYEWNTRLACETLALRETVRDLRAENVNLCASFFVIAWFVILATIWNFL